MNFFMLNSNNGHSQYSTLHTIIHQSPGDVTMHKTVAAGIITLCSGGPASNNRRNATQRLFVLVILSVALLAHATVYYVPKNGPFNIDSVNALSLRPGDKVLFERGGIYRGKVTVKASGYLNSPIIFAAYGVGAAPVISGAVPITGWTSGAGTIKQATVTQKISQLFCDDRPLTLARYPNHGFRTITSTSGGIFSDAGMEASKNWTGASAHIRTNRWTLSNTMVTAFNAGQKSVTLDVDPGISVGWGYFLNNTAAALDTAGEWYYDSDLNTVKVIMPDNGTVSSHVIEGSVYDFGFDFLSSSYVTVTGLCVRNQTGVGFNIINSNYITIRNNTVLYSGGGGIVIFPGTGHVVDSNTIYGMNRGIACWSSNSVFSNNHVIATAMLGLLGYNGNGGTNGGIGIWINPSTESDIAANSIHGNTIDSTGYNAIHFSGGSNIIEHNYINHSCMTTDDGAAIYAFTGDYTAPGLAGSVIRNNIIINSIGAPAGAPHVTALDSTRSATNSHGIYMDDCIHDVQIYGNTVAGCAGSGIFLHNNYNINVYDNTSFGNNYAQLWMLADNYTNDSMRTNRVLGNIFCSTSPTMFGLTLTTLESTRSTKNFAAFDSNYYWYPYSATHSYKSINSVSPGNSLLNGQFTLSNWKSLLGQDAASKESSADSSYTLTLLLNPTMHDSVVTLSPGSYRDLNGNTVASPVTLTSFASLVLQKTDASATTAASTAGIKSFYCRTVGTTVHFALPKSSFVRIRYYDISGRMVYSFANNYQQPGLYAVKVPRSLAKQMYIQDFRAGDFVKKQQIAILR